MTPLPLNYEPKRIGQSDKPVNVTEFQQRLASLGFLRHTRLDILHATHQLAKHGSSPTTYSNEMMNHLLGYLKNNPVYSRKFYNTDSEKNQLVALTDAAFANSGENWKSTSGNIVYYCSSLVHASSATQRQIATSAPEAELFEVIKSTKMLLHLKGLAEDMKERDIEVALLTDSSSSVGTVHSPVTSKYKYLSVYITFVKNIVAEVGLKVVHLLRDHNFADLMTKQSDFATFSNMWKGATEPFQWRHESKE